MDINTKRTRTTISIVMLIWAVVCIAVTGLYVGNNHAEAATTGTLTSDYVYFRKSPNGTPIKYNGSAILLRKGQKMTVLSTSNKTWYKVKLTYIEEALHRLCVLRIYQGDKDNLQEGSPSKK